MEGFGRFRGVIVVGGTCGVGRLAKGFGGTGVVELGGIRGNSMPRQSFLKRDIGSSAGNWTIFQLG